MTAVKRHNLSKHFGYVALVILGFGIGLILYWLYSVPDQPITINNKYPIPVLSATAPPNGYAVLNLDYCKNLNATGRSSGTLVGDKTQLMLPTIYDRNPKGCTNMRVAFPIPPQTTPGTYHFHFRTVYQANPLVNRTQEIDTENFKVE